MPLFPPRSTEGLDKATRALRATWPSPSLPHLIEQLDPARWPASRRALAALRRMEIAGMPAATAVAVWFARAAPSASDDYAGHGLREAASCLATWRGMARTYLETATGTQAQALERLLYFYDQGITPMMVGVLDGPVQRRVPRGIIEYLQDAHRPTVAADALSRWLKKPGQSRPDEDDELTREAAVAALAKLHAEHPPSAQPEPLPEPKPVMLIPEEPTAEWLAELPAPSRPLTLFDALIALTMDIDPTVRAAALEGIRCSGRQGAGVEKLAMDATQDADPQVRAAAAGLLGMLVSVS